MAQFVSLNQRRSVNAQQTENFPIVLVVITPEGRDPIRLSTDPTELVSREPLQYGTRSARQLYDFVLMGVMLPDDKEASPPAAQIVLDNVAEDMVAQVRAAGLRISVEMSVVFSNALDAVDQRWTNFRVISASYDVSSITLQISQQPILDEPYPSQRMTPSRFQGLFP